LFFVILLKVLLTIFKFFLLILCQVSFAPNIYVVLCYELAAPSILELFDALCTDYKSALAGNKYITENKVKILV